MTGRATTRATPAAPRRHRAGGGLLVSVLGALVVTAALTFVPAGSAVVDQVPGPCATANCATVVVDVGGDGRGTVTSDTGNISCTVVAGVESGTCSTRLIWPLGQPAYTITLTFSPSPGSAMSYNNKPAGNGGSITYTVASGDTRVVTGVTYLLTRHTLAVSTSGEGTGTVTSAPASTISSCRTPCSALFAYGTTVQLTATADAGATFRAWTGACAGQAATCTLTVQTALTTNAVFALPGTTPPPTPPPPAPPPPAQPPAGPPTPPATPADRLLDAEIGAARAARTPLGARTVRIELTAREQLTALLQLRRAGTTLASRRYPALPRGSRILTLLVPRRITAGTATLRLVLTDPAGNSKGARRQLTLPKP